MDLDFKRPEELKTAPKKKDGRLFAVVPYRALHDKNLPPRRLKALLIMCSYANKQGIMTVGTHKLAKDMGITQQTLADHMSKLTAQGYLMTISNRYYPGERAKMRAVIYDRDNPPHQKDLELAVDDNENESQLKQSLNKKVSVHSSRDKLSNELAILSVWKKAVLNRFPAATVSSEIPLDLTRYPIEKIKKAATLAVESCNAPPGSIRLILRFLKE